MTPGRGSELRSSWVRKYGKWLLARMEGNIRSLEYFPPLMAMAIWGQQLAGNRIVFISDNLAAVANARKQSAGSHSVMCLPRLFCFCRLLDNIQTQYHREGERQLSFPLNLKLRKHGWLSPRQSQQPQIFSSVGEMAGYILSVTCIFSAPNVSIQEHFHLSLVSFEYRILAMCQEMPEQSLRS